VVVNAEFLTRVVSGDDDFDPQPTITSMLTIATPSNVLLCLDLSFII
jgi:hypothetical protein